MASRELLAFSKFIHERIGVTDTSDPPLLGLLDAYGLTGDDREAMIRELQVIGAVKGVHIDATLHVDKLPRE